MRIREQVDVRPCVPVAKLLMYFAMVCAPCAVPLEQPAAAQTIKLEDADGYERYREVRRNLRQLRVTGTIGRIRWTDDGSGMYFSRERDRYRFDLDELFKAEADSALEAEEVTPVVARAPRIPPRGEQRDAEPSPCRKWIAKCVDWNVVIVPAQNDNDADEGEWITVTTDGHRKHRFGKASWVYGEELRQRDAMWWSADSRYLAYYELDERDVPDYYLTGGLTDLRTDVLVEGFPKAGDPNPIAKLWIYDLETEESIKVHTHDSDEERYIYRVQFVPNDRNELIFHRTNRLQNVLELVAADADTGESRVILTEEQETWQDNRPTLVFLDGGERFIWATERTGWKQFELRHVSGEKLATLSEGEFPVRDVEHVDEENGVLFYTAYCPEYPLDVYLYRVNLDGTEHKQLTSLPGHLTVNVAPDGEWFIAQYQRTDEPPVTKLHRNDGTRVEQLATADMTRFEELALVKPEPLELTAADGETMLYGVMFKPSGFDPAKTYPLVVDVYGGPYFQRVRNTWNPANAACEFGMIIATIDNRGTPNRGKAFEEAIYKKLGIVDLADQIAAVKQLLDRPYIDEGRVGIFGHSYGGYMAALAILKHPDLFHVAVVGGAVTDWRNYDTIYTERYMRTPDENEANYGKGSCLTYVDQLEGSLLIMHGMLDDNVHPANAWQLVDALQRAGKRFDMMFFPDAAHGLGPRAGRMRLEYLINHLPAGAQD